jgi:hypothetical protein
LRVRSLVSAESSRLKYVKTLRRLTAELEFLRDENRRGLQYIEQLLSDGRALRQSQRERAVCSRESVVRGYLKYIASQQRPRAVCAEVADIDYKPVNLDEYKGLTDPSVGDLDKSRLLCSLIAKIKDVCGDLTRCEEAVNRIEHSVAAILVDTAYDANIIQDEYTSLERAAIQRDFIAKDLLSLLQILPPESRESLPALASYIVQA